jgi:prenyltransferase beta subunit
MLKTAAAAAQPLDDSIGTVISFIRRQICDDGGFKSRAGQSDIYYSVFAIETLLSLGAEIPAQKIAAYLRQFGDGSSLDLVHLSSLVRCWANIEQVSDIKLDNDTRSQLARNLDSFKEPDGAYGTAYACFLAVGACQDLETELPDAGAIAKCLESLQTEDGAYSNEPGQQAGSTPATAAALVVQHYLDIAKNEQAAQWLLNQIDFSGGFVVTPALKQTGIPDLLSTATALHALGLLGVSTEDIKQKCLDFLDSLWSQQGGFCGSVFDRTVDCEYTYYGLLALGNLSK